MARIQYFSMLKYYHGLMHYPGDLCFWEFVTDENTGRPQTLQYQDDGYGNLILINRIHNMQILRFRHEYLH